MPNATLTGAVPFAVARTRHMLERSSAVTRSVGRCTGATGISEFARSRTADSGGRAIASDPLASVVPLADPRSADHVDDGVEVGTITAAGVGPAFSATT